MVKNTPVSVGGRRFDPWSGKIPYAVGHLKPMHHNYQTHVLQLLKPNHPRARALQEEPPQ